MAAASRFVDSFAMMIGKLAGSLMSIGLTIATNLIGGIESYLSNNVDRIKGWLVRMFDVGAEINGILGNFFVAFADVFSVYASQTAQDITGSIIQIFADIFGGILELGAKFARDLLDILLTPYVENAAKIKKSIAMTLEPVKTVIESIAATIRKVVDGVLKLYDDHIHPFFKSIKDGFSEIVGTINESYQEHIVPVMNKLANKFKEVMEGPVGDAIDSALNFLGKLVDAVKQLWEECLVPFANWLINTIVPILAPIIEMIGTVLLDALGTVAEIVDGLFDALSGLIDFIVGVFTGDWRKAWEGVKDIFSGIWDGIVSVVEGAVKIIGDIIDGIKGTIDAVFGTDFSTPKQMASTYSISYPSSVYAAIPYQMPRLATGTVVPPRAGEFAAILGDNNRETEVVSPLSTMKQALKEALAESNIGNNNQIVKAELVLDSTKFGQLVVKFGNSEKNRVGVRMVTT